MSAFVRRLLKASANRRRTLQGLNALCPALRGARSCRAFAAGRQAPISTALNVEPNTQVPAKEAPQTTHGSFLWKLVWVNKPCGVNDLTGFPNRGALRVWVKDCPHLGGPIIKAGAAQRAFGCVWRAGGFPNPTRQLLLSWLKHYDTTTVLAAWSRTGPCLQSNWDATECFFECPLG